MYMRRTDRATPFNEQKEEKKRKKKKEKRKKNCFSVLFKTIFENSSVKTPTSLELDKHRLDILNPTRLSLTIFWSLFRLLTSIAISPNFEFSNWKTNLSYLLTSMPNFGQSNFLDVAVLKFSTYPFSLDSFQNWHLTNFNSILYTLDTFNIHSMIF